VSQSSEFCRHNPLCYFSTNVYCSCLFRYRLSPENFGYTLVWSCDGEVIPVPSHHSMATYGGVKVKLLTFLTSVLDGCEQSASRFGHIAPRERAPDTYTADVNALKS
jgi:hypothetical protein